jgi:hypothetical protein
MPRASVLGPGLPSPTISLSGRADTCERERIHAGASNPRKARLKNATRALGIRPIASPKAAPKRLTSCRLPSWREPQRPCRRPWRRHPSHRQPWHRQPARRGSSGTLGGCRGSSATTASGSSARGLWIDTTGALRCVQLGNRDALGQRHIARNLVSFRFMFDRSSSRNSGRSFGRQLTSTSERMCDTTPPWTFTPGDTLRS